jgi:hypothetical protein
MAAHLLLSSWLVEEVNRSSRIRTHQKLSLMFICRISTFTDYCISTFTSYCLRFLGSYNVLNLCCSLIANQMQVLFLNDQFTSSTSHEICAKSELHFSLVVLHYGALCAGLSKFGS